MDGRGMTSFCLGGRADTLGYHAPPDHAPRCFRRASSFRVVVPRRRSASSFITRWIVHIDG
jgi:hypothetical protein